MVVPSLVKKGLTIRPNVNGAWPHKGGDTSRELGPGRRASLPGDRSPEVRPFGPILRVGKLILRLRERVLGEASLGPSDPEGPQGPEVIGGGSDAPIGVNIGTARGREAALRGLRVLKVKDLGPHDLKKLPSIEEILFRVAVKEHIFDQRVNSNPRKMATIPAGVAAENTRKVGAPIGLVFMQLEGGREPHKQRFGHDLYFQFMSLVQWRGTHCLHVLAFPVAVLEAGVWFSTEFASAANVYV